MTVEYDLIIKNGMILTLDPGDTIIENGMIGIKKDRIAHVGRIVEGPGQALKVIDAKGGIILPGLVNAHTHAAMSLFRGLADDLPLMDWLNHYIFPAEAKMDADFVYTGTLLACAEMILSGTTTFCDMYLFEDETAKAAKQAGMRCLAGEVLYDFPSPNYGSIENGFKYTRHLIDKWKNDPLISIAVEPHSPYTCSPELLQRASELAMAHNIPLVIHMAETRHEISEIREKYGRSPFAHLDHLGVLGPHVIADHCVFVDEKEMDLMARNRVKVVHNPESNMKLASGIAPIPALMKKGITVALGTDGCASNNDLDLFSEMDTAAKLHKIAAMDPTVMDARSVLKMATLNGAKALGMEKITGSLEIGKKADVIVVNTNKPHLTPLYNPFSHLVYAAKGSDVVHSIINGRVVMENRTLLTLDLEEVMEKAWEKAIAVKTWIA
ncbi:MAG: amidohydrolase [Desulfobacteraceae bacterium]|nr:amidohydrolase [Desulfobacteraceae bacterium]MBU4054211.1 amidohydrolase [Pseudomonadota bacterium]